MATYILPQPLVFQDFRIVPTAALHPLPAHISAGHAHLIRFNEPGEQANGLLGYYDRLQDIDYDWPNRPAGAKVDNSYTKVYIKNGLLRYFHDDIGAGAAITKTSGYNNRIRSATTNFAANGDDYPRSALLLDRDVQPGDIVKVRGVNGDGDSVSLWTYVRRLIGDVVASVVGAAESDDSNAASQSASSEVVKVSGPDNCVVATVDETAYDGLADGDITETYDIIVTESSAGGDFTTATLRVISGSGNDDDDSVSPAAAGEATSIGSRGLTVTFDVSNAASCSESAEADGVAQDDLIAGQRWQVTVNQAFSPVTPTSGGSFDSANDSTYIVTVTRGGQYAADLPPQISVTTTNGIDISGPTDITAAATFVDIGTLGVQIKFSGSALRKGDRYYVEATGEAAGPMRTIELGNNLDSTIAGGSEVSLDLFIKKPILEIEQNRTGFAPLLNWEPNDAGTQITINSGIIAYDSTWTDDGVPQPLDVYSESTKKYGALYVEYRAWLSTLAHEVGTISDPADIDLISGSLTPDNPLKWGVYLASLGANGTPVKYTAVADPEDIDSWVDVLEVLVGRDDVYGLAPMTRDRNILDLFAAHCLAQSTPEQELWRVLWTNLQGVPEIPVVSAGSTIPGHTEATTSDGEVCLAVVEDDSQTSGSQYTIVRVTSDNSNFLVNNVRPGDVVRMLYTGDGFGNYTYSEYLVDEVQSEDQLRLLTGPDAPINTAAKIEVWRNLSATEEAEAIARNSGSWGNRRIRSVWPDQIENSGTIMEGYFLCAYLAGLSSGILPHQGMTRLEITGFTDVSRTVNKFNKTQLDALALAGTWIVTQDLQTGKVYTRHAVTTGSYDDLNEREEMVTRNTDSISYRFKETLMPFIGVMNVTPVVGAKLRRQMGDLITVLKSELATEDLGGQIIDATITKLDRHLTLLDRYVIVIDCELPYPFNNAELHLVI